MLRAICGPVPDGLPQTTPGAEPHGLIQAFDHVSQDLLDDKVVHVDCQALIHRALNLLWAKSHSAPHA
eukprot:590080-Pyramimonas_sp.AAC.1